MEVINDCAISWCQKHLAGQADTFIYADPPYVSSSRRSSADIYEYELTDQEHMALSQILTTTMARVIISGYDCGLYDKLYAGWNKKIMPVSVHGKRTNEVVWYNYDTPSTLHQYNFVGNNKTERQRIKRKINRWVERLNALPTTERNAIIASLHA